MNEDRMEAADCFFAGCFTDRVGAGEMRLPLLPTTAAPETAVGCEV